MSEFGESNKEKYTEIMCKGVIEFIQKCTPLVMEKFELSGLEAKVAQSHFFGSLAASLLCKLLSEIRSESRKEVMRDIVRQIVKNLKKYDEGEMP